MRHQPGSPNRSRARTSLPGVAMLALMLLGWFVAPDAAAQSSVTIGVRLEGSQVLILVACRIEVVAGGTVVGDLNDCVSGGQGVRHFGPVGGPVPTPDGGSITIRDDGTFTYTAGPYPGIITIPFTAIDDSLTEPLAGNVEVDIHSRLVTSSPVFHVSPGAIITGNLNDYVTGGFGTRQFGPTGSGMPTLGGGTITIEADGSFTYVAPNIETNDSFPFSVADASATVPVPGTAFVEVRGDAAITPTPPPAPNPTVTPAATTTATTEATPLTTVKIETLPTTGSGSSGKASGFGTSLQVVVLLLLAGTIGHGAMRGRRCGRRTG